MWTRTRGPDTCVSISSSRHAGKWWQTICVMSLASCSLVSAGSCFTTPAASSPAGYALYGNSGRQPISSSSRGASSGAKFGACAGAGDSEEHAPAQSHGRGERDAGMRPFQDGFAERAEHCLGLGLGGAPQELCCCQHLRGCWAVSPRGKCEQEEVVYRGLRVDMLAGHVHGDKKGAGKKKYIDTDAHLGRAVEQQLERPTVRLCDFHGRHLFPPHT